MKLNLSELNDEVRIEILPLMDVIFCILTFFILGAVGLTRQQAITQNLPQASTGESYMTQMFRVSIDALGRVYVNRETNPIGFDELAARMAAHQRSNPEELVVLYANPQAQYDDVIQVLDLLRSIGGDRVTLGIRPSAESPLERNQNSPNGANFMPFNPQFNPQNLQQPNSPQSGSPSGSPSGSLTDPRSNPQQFNPNTQLDLTQPGNPRFIPLNPDDPTGTSGSGLEGVPEQPGSPAGSPAGSPTNSGAGMSDSLTPFNPSQRAGDGRSLDQFTQPDSRQSEAE